MNNRSATKFKEIRDRPYTRSGLDKMKNWFMERTWDQVFQAETANEKANICQQLLLKALNNYLPEKIT